MARQALSARSQRLRIALALPALVAIFLLGQAILDRMGLRLDLTPEARYSLSPRARQILDGLPSDVRVLAFLRSQDPRNLLIEDMLRQVEARSPRVKVDVYDVNRSPALARRYGVDSYGALVVESEGRRRVMSSPREEILLAAMLQVTRQERKSVAWVVGHGEGDIANSERRRGWSTARGVLEQEYYDVRPISLLTDDVPPETSVLVIAGPEKDFLPGELAALARHLQRPGNALVLLDPLRAPALAQFLRPYGLELPPDVVVEPSARIYGGEVLTMRLPIDPAAHPILGPLQASPLLPSTRSVAPSDEPGTNGMVFLRTSADAWATRDTAVLEGAEPHFEPGRDERGPVPVGAEVAFRTLTSPGEDPRQGRLVAIGNAQFANNFFIEFLGNKDLFVNAVAWLARDPQAITQRPLTQALGTQQFFVSAEQGAQAFWLTVVLQPALFAAIGIALVVYRRRS